MIGIIGEIKKFIVSKETVKFLTYTNTFNDMLLKIDKMHFEFIDNENNKDIKYKVENNIPVLPIECKEEVIGAVAVYYDTLDNSVKLGEINETELCMALTIKDLKYCYKDINNEIKLCKGTPIDKIIYRESDLDCAVIETLDTGLYLDVRDAKGNKLNIPITAKYNVCKSKNNESEYPIIFSDLEMLHDLQCKKKDRKDIEKKLDISIEEFNSVEITKDDFIKYKLDNVRKLKLLKIYERRFKNDYR